MANSKQPKKSTDKSNKIDKIRNIVHNTEENFKEAEISKEFTDDPTQREQLEEKNARRKQSIQALKDEIKEELHKGNKD